MVIVVTGGAGFIGSHLVDRLLLEGNTVYIIDNFDPFYDEKIKRSNIQNALQNKNCALFKTDITNNQELNTSFDEIKEQIDCVVHLAAKAGVRPSFENPIGYYQTNVTGTLNILEIMKNRGIKKLIFASSSSVYGNNVKVPFSESDNVDFPISPYASTKKTGELLCHVYHSAFNIDIFCLRFFTVYGPRQRPDLAIHKFTKLIYDNKPIHVYGKGNTRRDYTYIGDIVDGVVKSIQNVKGYEILNIGNSQTVQLIDLLNIFKKEIDVEVKTIFIEEQLGDVVQTFADISKAKSLISYEPKTTIESGVKKFITWYLEQKKEIA